MQLIERLLSIPTVLYRWSLHQPMQLSLDQKFEIERMKRIIESEQDPVELQSIAKQLLEVWQSQRAATRWVVRQHLSGSAWPSSPAE